MDVTQLRKALKEVMQRDGLNAINVASDCDVDDLTVSRFLDGVGTPRRVTLRAFQQFVNSRTLVSPQATRAASGG